MENFEGRMNGEAHRIMVRSAAEGGAEQQRLLPGATWWSTIAVRSGGGW